MGYQNVILKNIQVTPMKRPEKEHRIKNKTKTTSENQK